MSPPGRLYPSVDDCGLEKRASRNDGGRLYFARLFPPDRAGMCRHPDTTLVISCCGPLADMVWELRMLSAMNPAPVTILQTAASLAAKAHAGQVIRTSDIPYIAHTVGVSMAVSCLFGCPDPEVAAAALLHDTLEKTRLTGAEIRDALGPRVLRLVVAMTKGDGYNKSEYWELLYDDVWEARLIKMGDALDHLDCPLDELPRRIKSGKRALELAYSDEPPIQAARRVLGEALSAATDRLAS
jgi:hypothetical protein